MARSRPGPVRYPTPGGEAIVSKATASWLTIGITHEEQGPEAWSGIPHALATALNHRYARVRRVTSEVDPVLAGVSARLGVWPWSLTQPRWLEAVQGAETRVRRPLGPDGHPGPTATVPYITYDDTSVLQLLRSADTPTMSSSTVRR
jgi:hypothetical protein